MTIREFMRRHYRHFNAAVCVDAAQGWVDHLGNGGKMLITLAGAMSTAELGISLAEMIRQDKVHGICCTGANLEEDIFNLVAHSHYERVPHYRALSADDEQALYDHGMNRVTDTCIPEDEAIRRIESHMLALWQCADRKGQSYFPYEFMYQLIESGELVESYEIDPKDSWLLAAHAKRLPIFVPGWEDSTLGNIFVSHVIRGDISRYSTVRSGLETMGQLVKWYKETTANHSLAGVLPGDVIQFSNVTIVNTTTYPNGSWTTTTQTADHHTAIVESVSGSTIHVLEQNANSVMTVQHGSYDLDGLQGGTMWIYQPISLS